MHLSSWNLPGAGRLVWDGGHTSPCVMLCLVRKRGASGKAAWRLVMEQGPSCLCDPPPERALAPTDSTPSWREGPPEATCPQSSFLLLPLAGGVSTETPQRRGGSRLPGSLTARRAQAGLCLLSDRWPHPAVVPPAAVALKDSPSGPGRLEANPLPYATS